MKGGVEIQIHLNGTRFVTLEILGRAGAFRVVALIDGYWAQSVKFYFDTGGSGSGIRPIDSRRIKLFPGIDYIGDYLETGEYTFNLYKGRGTDSSPVSTSILHIVDTPNKTPESPTYDHHLMTAFHTDEGYLVDDSTQEPASTRVTTANLTGSAREVSTIRSISDESQNRLSTSMTPGGNNPYGLPDAIWNHIKFWGAVGGVASLIGLLARRVGTDDDDSM